MKKRPPLRDTVVDMDSVPLESVVDMEADIFDDKKPVAFIHIDPPAEITKSEYEELLTQLQIINDRL